MTSNLEPGSKLGERIIIDRELNPGEYTARDEESGAAVRVVLLDPSELAGLEVAPSVQHAHLAHALLVSSSPPALAVEDVAGETLGELVSRIGKKTPVDAVRFTLRMADALTALHRAGGVFGRLGPEAVIALPEGGREGPVLLPAATRSLRPPEVAAGSAPTPGEDAWAVMALLHLCLTGELPSGPGPASLDDLLDVPSVDLRQTLLHGLHRDPEQRQHELTRLKGELARWFVEHGNEDSQPSIRATHSMPPPLPPSSPGSSAHPPGSATLPAVSSPAQEPARGGWGRTAAIAAVALLVGSGAVFLVFALTPPSVVEVPVAQQNEQPPTGPGKGAEVDLSEVSVKASAVNDKVDDPLAACVAGYLPPDTFQAEPDLAFICDEGDASAGAAKLRAEIVKGAKGAVSPGMKLFSQLGWYELPTYAIVRAGCCVDSKPVTLPEPTEGCDSVAAAVQKLAVAVPRKGDTKEPLEQFDKAIRCEAGKGKSGAYGRTGPPDGGQRSSFEGYLKSLDD